MIAENELKSKGCAWTLADRVLVGVLGVVSALALLQIGLMGFGRDQGIYAMVANTVLEGGMPYRDAWDFKPPGIFLVYTFTQALFGTNEWGIRLVEVFSFASLIPLLGVFARRFFGDARIGWVAAVLAIWVQAQLEFWHTAQPESFGGVLALAGLVISTHPARFDGSSGRWIWARLVAAGLVFGLAGLMKPHLLGVPIVAASHAFLRLRTLNEPLKRQVAAFCAVGIGSTATVCLCLLWFAIRGAFGDLHLTLFVFAPGYAATTWNSSYLVYYSYSALRGAAMGFSAIVAVGIVLSVGLGPRARREREGLWLVFVAAVPQLLGIAIQSKFFPYHYGSVLPFWALLAAPGLWKVWKLSQKLPVAGLGPGIFAIALLLAVDARSATCDLPESFWERSKARTHALAGSREDRARVDARLYTVADVNYGANLRVAAWLQAHTDPSDKVFIWGFEPHIYYASDRKPASKYIYNVAQRVEWENQWARDELMRELEAAPPRVIVVERGDSFPVVTGNDDDSAGALLDFGRLHRFITEHYGYQHRIQDFEIYVRKP